MTSVTEAKDVGLPDGEQTRRSSHCYAFRVWCKDRPDFETTINTRTAGRAKREYLDRLLDAGWGFTFVDLRVQKLGPCHTSEQFRSNARYRGVPNVECGQRVIVGVGRGVIVGHNASANFDVLFDDDSPRYAGMTLNVHPGEVQYA